MCNALDENESYWIATLVRELGMLYDEGKGAVTQDARARVAADRRRVSVKLFEIESRIELRHSQFLDIQRNKMYR